MSTHHHHHQHNHSEVPQQSQSHNSSSYVERGALRFLLIDCPTNANLDSYLKDMKSHGVTDLVRACECEEAYDAVRVTNFGIAVHNLPFEDGDAPPTEIVNKFLEICNQVFSKGNPTKKCIAVHCIAGLGRTPVLVALGLIQDGVEPLDAVTLIRAKRRGAINAKQLRYLQAYQPKKGKGGCCIM